MFIVVTFLLFIFNIKNVSGITNLTVGLLIPKGSALENDVGYRSSAGAVIVALNNAIKNQIYDPSLYNITFTWNYTQCDESLAVGYTTKMIKNRGVSAIFGPTCIESAEIVGSLSAYTKTAIFLWSTVGGKFTQRPKYPTAVLAAGTVNGLVTATANVLKQFNWTQVGFLYTTVDGKNAEHVPFCSYYAQSFQNSTSTYLANISTYTRFVPDESIHGFKTVLNAMNSRARVIIACLEKKADIRNLMLAATENKMLGGDYVYLLIQTSATGFDQVPFWQTGDENATILKEAAKSVFILDKFAEETKIKEQVDKQIVENIRGWPFYDTSAPSNTNVSNLAFYLGDSFYIYLQCLNWTYTKYGASQLTNSSALLENLIANTFSFPSIMGNNFTSLRGFRLGRYALWSFNYSSTPTIFGIAYSLINDTGSTYKANYQSETDSIWAIRGGYRPRSIPICGFNKECPPSPLIYAAISVASVFLFMLVVVFLFSLIVVFQKQQRKKRNALWQIPFMYLQKDKNRRSSLSNQNELNTTSDQQKDSLKTKNTEFFLLDHEIVVAQKHPYYSRWSFAEEDEFRKMRKCDNEKLNSFLGVSISTSGVYYIWSHCERGNLIEVIKAHSFRFDSIIMVGMIREIAEGLYYIHNSSFLKHGNLNAYCCVVGDRFDVKIQDYGCSAYKTREIRNQCDKYALYVAPEHLKGQQTKVGSQEGDIYSFSIIMSVILTMKPAFGIEDTSSTNSIEDTINAVLAGLYPPFRPSLETDLILDIHPELFTLIKDCWSEIPTDRPNIDDINRILFKRWGEKPTNLMDHMFSLMENSASELEHDVKMRSLELQSEQKKADTLLYKIMPREAADKLKSGKIVTPEVFEQATVFFSDIVSFTVLASKSTPLQIINFLNDVYTLTDSVIDKYDVYKVETIGDGLHIVSGVPKRNGTNHVKEICNMAIDFQRKVKTLRMSHLPDKEIQMRVGVHSGSAVAGIVGMTNPRFIVLGDTVNIAAKMEASGKAGQIHITQTTKDLLETHYPNKFCVEERGETLIKGIGPMNTYWLTSFNNK